jgi:hypothetical protein
MQCPQPTAPPCTPDKTKWVINVMERLGLRQFFKNILLDLNQD